VNGEDIRSSGLVNGRLVMDYMPRCRGVQVDREPDDGLSRRVFGDFLTARM
jgi:Zn-finger nucleic acid-binding protein